MVGRLILKAAEWSPQSHELFPEAARKWAVEVMRLGYLIAWDEERFEGREGAAPELADDDGVFFFLQPPLLQRLSPTGSCFLSRLIFSLLYFFSSAGCKILLLHTAVAWQTVNELACGDSGIVHGAKCIAVLNGVA